MINTIKATEHWLFDFDGTLVDSMGYWAGAMVSVLDKYDIKYEEDIISIITPLGTKGTVKYFQTLGLDLSEEAIRSEIFDILTPIYLDTIMLKPGVKNCLSKMKASGYKLHVLTASPHVWLDPCLVRNGIAELFENIWSCDDDFGKGKNDPDIYISAAARIGTAVENVTFLDDNINADKAAKLSGMRVIGVYDKSSASDESDMRNITDSYVYDFLELQTMLGI